MEDGFLTLLFILLMVGAAIMDAVGRRRSKQRRMEEMEEEEEARERPMPSGRSEPTRTDSGERETAETMVPEDFWAILTGQEPERRPPPEQRPPPEPDMGRRGDPDPPKEPRIPTPVPDERYSTHEAGGVGEADDVPRWGRSREDEESRDTGAIGDEEAAVYAQPHEPWGELADISAGDLTEGTEGEVLEATAPGRPRQAAARRRGGGRGRYTRLLETGDIEDLRKAVVLREVLDRPVGFRDDVGPDW